MLYCNTNGSQVYNLIVKLQFLITTLLLLATIFFGIATFNSLPATVPSHWNVVGEVDGYVSKTTHVFLFLGLCTVLPIFMYFVPRLDPKYANIQKFEGSYLWFVLAFTAFLDSLYVYTTMFALGYRFPINYFIIPAMAALIFVIGMMLETAKSNYTIGFRLPWTLHSEKNWDLTHQLAATSLKYGSAVLVLTVFLGNYAFAVFMTFLFAMFLVPVFYSYWLHRKGI